MQVLCVEDVPPDLRRREARRGPAEAPRVSSGYALSCREVSGLWPSDSPCPAIRLGSSPEARKGRRDLKSVPGECVRPGESLFGLRPSCKELPGGLPARRTGDREAVEGALRLLSSSGSGLHRTRRRELRVCMALAILLTFPDTMLFPPGLRYPSQASGEESQMCPSVDRTLCAFTSLSVMVSGIGMRCPSSKS